MLSLKGSSGTVSSHIYPEVLETAKSICRMGLQNCTDPRVCTLSWANETKGAVNQRGGDYFILNVDKATAQEGFFVQCTTSSRVNFKLVLFNGAGEALFEQDSHVNAQSLTDATLFFTNFETSSLATQSAGIASGESSDFVVKMCDSISNFGVRKNSIGPGTYLVAVQCATMLSRTSFLLYAVRANNDERLVRNVTAVDKKILQSAKELAAFKDEYLKAKAAYKAALLKSADEEQKLSELLERRNFRYFEFVDSSMKQSAMPPRSKPEGWLSRHLSLGKNAIEAIVKSPSQNSLTPSNNSTTNTASTKSNDTSAPQKPPKPSRPQSVPNPNRSNSMSSVPFQSSANSGTGNGTGIAQTEKRPAPMGKSKSAGAKVIERFVYTGEDDEAETAAVSSPASAPVTPLAAPSAAAALFASVEEHHASASEPVDTVKELSTADTASDLTAASVTASEAHVEESPESVPAHSENSAVAIESETVAFEPLAIAEVEASEQDAHSPPAVATSPQPDELCASQSLSDQGSVSSMELSPHMAAPSSLHPTIKTDYGDWEGGSLQSQDTGGDSGVVVEKPSSFSSADTLTPNGHHNKHVHWDEETFPSAHSSLSVLETSEPTSESQSPAFAAYESDECVSPVPVEEPEPEESREEDSESPSAQVVLDEEPEVEVEAEIATEIAVDAVEPAITGSIAEEEPTVVASDAVVETEMVSSADMSSAAVVSSPDAEVVEETYEEEPFYVHSETFDEYVPDEPVGVEGNEDEPFFVHSETVDEYAVNADQDQVFTADAEISPTLSEDEEGYEKVERSAPVSSIAEQETDSALVLNDPELLSRSELTPPPIESPPVNAIPPPAIGTSPEPSSLALEEIEPELSHSLSVSPSPTPVVVVGKAGKNNKKKKNNKKNKRKNSVDKATDGIDADGADAEGEGDTGADDADEEGEQSPRPASFSVTSMDGALVPEQLVSPLSPEEDVIGQEENIKVSEPIVESEAAHEVPAVAEVATESEAISNEVPVEVEDTQVEDVITAPSPIAVLETEQENVFVEESSMLDYSIDTLPEHALDTTLDTSADFADAMEPPAPRVWDAHPAAKDQTPIPMVWDLPGVAAESTEDAEEAVEQADTVVVDTVDIAEPSEDVVKSEAEVVDEVVSEVVDEAPEEAVVEGDSRPVTPVNETSPKTGKGKNNKKKGKGKGGKAAVAAPVVAAAVAPVAAPVPSPVAPAVAPVETPVEEVVVVEAPQTSSSESDNAVEAPVVEGEKETAPAPVQEETPVTADSDVNATKNTAPVMAIDPFAPISSDPFASNVLVTPTASAPATMVTPPSAASSVWDQPSVMLSPSYTPSRASIYDEDEGGAPVYEPPTHVALSLSHPQAPSQLASPAPGPVASAPHTQPRTSFTSPAVQSPAQFDFSTPSIYTPVYPRTPSSKSSIKANTKYLEMPDPFAGVV